MDIRCLFVFFLGFLTFSLLADTVKADAVKSALDAPSGVVFGDCVNGKTVASYTETNINGTAMPVEIWEYDEEENEILLPNPNFLQLIGSGTPVDKERLGRIKSSLSFRVAGAGTLRFFYRVATYGENDDMLVFYEDDIDDFFANEDLGGDYWYKKSTEDGETTWGLDLTEEGGDTFFNEGCIIFDTRRYFHNVQVALLAPQKEDYVKPSTEEEDAVIKYFAWLDCFQFVADEATEVCIFSEPDGSTFSENGLDVYLDSDYYDENSNAERTDSLTFYYTLDGKKPTNHSTRYDMKVSTGIHVGKENLLADGMVHLRVAVYEGGTLIGDSYQALYSLREAPGQPTCDVLPQIINSGAEILFSSDSESPSLEYYYTTDGAEPTTISRQGESACILSPCTLTVKAYDEGRWSPAAVFYVKRGEAPSLSLTADGFSTSLNVFHQSASFSLKTTTPFVSYYKVNGGEYTQYGDPVTVFETSAIEYQAVYAEVQECRNDKDTLWLNSPVTGITLKKAVPQSSDWFTGQLSQENGWNLVGIKYLIPPVSGAALAKSLRPYEYNEKTRSFTLANMLESGKCYWIYGNQYTIPAEIPCVRDVPAESSRSGKWSLVPQGAIYTYKDNSYHLEQAETQEPGWKKGK